MTKPRTYLAAAVAAAIVAIGCGTPAPKARDLDTAPAPVAPNATAPAAQPAGIGEGSWEVGTDVKAGTYTTTVPAGEHCYWARLKDFDGELESVIANGNLSPGAKGRLVVKATDKGVEMRGACRWLPVKAKGAAK